ncbi:MAG TPA: 4-(cytidine 5'-diphospho)-2-C-methyl-D-erythritol kinase [Firmicutes bacterium]|nr:4-(cytidine 5'-diphospho)-2-C-methyl-D-erythritol kinase [Bacillota bacterium]
MDESFAGITIPAYAKINLYLAVGDRRADGYHPITSIMHLISLHDSVTVSPAHDEGVQITVEFPDHVPGQELVPTDDTNSVTKVISALGISSARVHLVKRIPPGSGLGGESADAAAALTACASGSFNAPELFRISTRLGSDVGFFLSGGSAALVTGAGETVTPVEPFPGIQLVLAMPPRNLSTAAVYREFDSCGFRSPGSPNKALRAMASKDLPALCRCLRNDLQLPAEHLAPEITQIRHAFQRLGVLAAQVTGSGSAVFGIVENEKEAREVSSALAAEPFVEWTCVCETIALRR